MIKDLFKGVILTIKRLLAMIRINNHSFAGLFAHGSGVSIANTANLVILKGHILRLGENCYIGRYCEIGPNVILIGDNVSIQDRCILLGDIEIGSNCLFAPNVFVSSFTHHYALIPEQLIKDQDQLVMSDDFLENKYSRKVVIHEDCWIGINSVVMRGITIGKGAVVGANSVVTKDIAPYTVVAGTPARVIKTRLNFAPPRFLIWKNPAHLPYFYKGFYLKTNDIQLHSCYGGIATRNSFIVALDVLKCSNIHISIMATSNGGQLISYQNTSLKLVNSMHDLSFPIYKQNDIFHCFDIDNDSNELLIVEKIWAS